MLLRSLLTRMAPGGNGSDRMACQRVAARLLWLWSTSAQCVAASHRGRTKKGRTSRALTVRRWPARRASPPTPTASQSTTIR